MFLKPFVVDIVKATFDVSFQYPLGSRLSRQYNEGLFAGLRKPKDVWSAVVSAMGSSANE